MFIARVCSVVGLDLSARAYAGPNPLREEGHTRLLGGFRALLHPVLGWASEVPLPHPGDQRRWDGMIRALDWRYGVEAEMGPHDAQALAGRIALKLRDGGVDGVILVLPESRRIRTFLAAAEPILAPHFPVPGNVALEALRRGEDPGGSSVIVIRPSRSRSGPKPADQG